MQVSATTVSHHPGTRRRRSVGEWTELISPAPGQRRQRGGRARGYSGRGRALRRRRESNPGSRAARSGSTRSSSRTSPTSSLSPPAAPPTDSDAARSAAVVAAGSDSRTAVSSVPRHRLEAGDETIDRAIGSPQFVAESAHGVERRATFEQRHATLRPTSPSSARRAPAAGWRTRAPPARGCAASTAPTGT